MPIVVLACCNFSPPSSTSQYLAIYFFLAIESLLLLWKVVSRALWSIYLIMHSLSGALHFSTGQHNKFSTFPMLVFLSPWSKIVQVWVKYSCQKLPFFKQVYSCFHLFLFAYMSEWSKCSRICGIVFWQASIINDMNFPLNLLQWIRLHVWPEAPFDRGWWCVIFLNFIDLVL